MTIKNDIVLWDNGADKFCLLAIPNEAQYKYIDNIPCITFGISYENFCFKGYETFTLFDKFYTDTIEKMGTVHHSLNGAFRICDVGADTDGYIDFEMNNGKLLVKGQLAEPSKVAEINSPRQTVNAIKGRVISVTPKP